MSKMIPPGSTYDLMKTFMLEELAGAAGSVPRRADADNGRFGSDGAGSISIRNSSRDTTLKVGYQGTPGSYSEGAAIEFMKQRKEQDYRLLALVTSERVAEGLRNRDIDFGVAATKNSTAGIVAETNLALPETDFDRQAHCTLGIAHCLFVMSSNCRIEDLRTVISHEQALRQCSTFIATHLKGVKIRVERDTALAAENLSRGVYGVDTAVICSRHAGELRTLYPVFERVQDNSDNETTFALFARKQATTE